MFIIQDLDPGLPFECQCKMCPVDPKDWVGLEHSKCCHVEPKIKSEMQEESVNCVIHLKRMAKLWDKVWLGKELKSFFQYIYHQRRS